MWFTAKSCSFYEGFETKEDPHEERPQAERRRSIRVKLEPGREDGERRTAYSMFGTGRRIEDFQLEIHPVGKSKRDESCEAWGCVSYTTEIDFRNQTTDDCVIFYLFVSDETFAQYCNQIAGGNVDGITFSVGSVAGFYSEWSPSISTGRVKVLTAASEHDVAGVTKGDIPRLGRVGEARLSIHRSVQFRPESKDDDDATPAPIEHRPPANSQPTGIGPINVVLAPLKRVLWVIACLLGLVFLAIIFNR